MTEAFPPEPRDRSAAVAAHRRHQSDWREKVLGWPAGPPTHPGAAKRFPVLGSCLATDFTGRRVKDEGLNLMSPAARQYARFRQEELRKLGGLAESERLWRNLLSSQPLAFSIAGELRAHPQAAARVFADLTGLDVVVLERLEDPGSPSHHLDGIEAEWFPPRDLHTGDRSGFDMAAFLCLRSGERLLVSVEVKYVDTFSAKKLEYKGYTDYVNAAGLGQVACQDIVANGGSHFLRSVLLTDSLRRQGLRGGGEVDRTLAVVLARSDDKSAAKVVQTIARYQPRTPVALWSHENFLDACAVQPELTEWAARMRALPARRRPVGSVGDFCERGSLHRRVFRLSYEAPVGGCSNERRLHHLGQGSVKAR